MSFPPSFWHQLEDRLNLAVHDINHMRFDTRSISKDDLTAALDQGDKDHGTTERNTRFEGQTLIVEWPTKEVKTVSPIDRIKAKAARAATVAPDAIKAFEADLDGILAEKPLLDQKRAAAVAPHKEVIASVYGEIDGLKSAMDILSNGGPALDPLPGSDTGAKG